MTRFAFTSLLILLIAGCQTAGRRPQSTFVAHTPAPSAKQFWNKTAKFLHPLMPDTGKRNADAESQLANNRPHSDILPINHSAHSLYKAGSIFPSLALQEPDECVAAVTAETITSNPLKIQSGDSEAFQGLLREIAIVPSEKLRVEHEKLTEMLTTFRDEIMDSEFEYDYLALLRKQILPESVSPKSSAPIPHTELAETKRPVTKREFPVVYDGDEEEFDDLLPQPAPKRALPNRESAVIAQSTATLPTPVYPPLTQLPAAPPEAVQVNYQAPYAQNAAPHNIATTGYGAGDWQTLARATVEQLRYAIEQTPNGRTVSNEIRLRMLEMLLGNQSEAARPIKSADDTVNRFMGNQVLGFAALLDDTASDTRNKYNSAAYRFTEGLAELQNLCPIKLKNVMFVKDWLEYGKYFPHPNSEFYPGEAFIVYMEIENPVVRRDAVAKGYEICVSLSYEIRDANAKVVVKKEIGTLPEMTLSRKRDFALAIGTGPVPTMLPSSLPPGQYYLRINMIDMNDSSMQYAEEQIPFRVVPSSSESSQDNHDNPYQKSYEAATKSGLGQRERERERENESKP